MQEKVRLMTGGGTINGNRKNNFTLAIVSIILFGLIVQVFRYEVAKLGTKLTYSPG